MQVPSEHAPTLGRHRKETVMSVVKINAIAVPEGMGPMLEQRFAERARIVETMPGFEGFELLRPVSASPATSSTRDGPTRSRSKRGSPALVSVRGTPRPTHQTASRSPPTPTCWRSRSCSW